MNWADMVVCVREAPVIVPVFRVVKVTPRLKRLGMARGDEIARYPEGSWVPLTGACKYNPEMASGQVEFIEYRDRKSGTPWRQKETK